MTAKPEPGDIDITLVANGSHLQTLIDKRDPNLRLFNIDFLRDLCDQESLRIDPFILPWNPRIERQSSLTYTYEATRGYWDDWWQRQRQGDKDNTPTIGWAVPRQGYLEVILNGYE